MVLHRVDPSFFPKLNLVYFKISELSTLGYVGHNTVIVLLIIISNITAVPLEVRPYCVVGA